jgi:hypothetical protein
MRYHSWLRHCATSWKVMGSIPDETIGCFNWPNPSSRTMPLGLTQPLTEMSTRNLTGVKGSWYVSLTISRSFVSQLSTKCGSLDVSKPYWPPRSVTGIDLFFYILTQYNLVGGTNALVNMLLPFSGSMSFECSLPWKPQILSARSSPWFMLQKSSCSIKLHESN